jgi:hypothetical protein
MTSGKTPEVVLRLDNVRVSKPGLSRRIFTSRAGNLADKQATFFTRSMPEFVTLKPLRPANFGTPAGKPAMIKDEPYMLAS